VAENRRVARRDGLYVSRDGGKTVRLLAEGLAVPSGRSRIVSLDRGRLFFLTSGSGVWCRRLVP